MTIDTEKLRALSRGCEYTVKATEAGDVSELWAVRFDVMGRPYNSRIGVTSHGVAALVAAAVNALPELLDAVDRKDAALALAETAHASTCAELATAQQAVVNLLSCKHCGGETDGFCDWRCRACERETPTDGACPGRCVGDGLLQVRQALATAEAERLTLARAVERERVRYERGLQLEPQHNAYDLAARIVAEADAASKEVRRG